MLAVGCDVDFGFECGFVCLLSSFAWFGFDLWFLLMPSYLVRVWCWIGLVVFCCFDVGVWVCFSLCWVWVGIWFCWVFWFALRGW